MMPPDPAVLRFKDQCASKINGPYPEVIAVPAAEGDLSVITDAQLLQEQRIMHLQIEEARQNESKNPTQQEEKKSHQQQGKKKRRRKSPPFLSWRNTILLVLVAILLSLGAFAGTFCGLGNCGDLLSVFRRKSKQDNQSGNVSNPTDSSPVPAVVEFIQSKFRNTTALRYPPLVGASSEELALAWIVQYDRKFPLPANAYRVVQRFVLAIFHFQQLKHYQSPIEGWLTNSDYVLNECFWKHVKCNDKNRVQEIDFSDAGLHGTIPDAIGLLSDLEVFAAADNELVGTLPATFGRCTKLKQLTVNNNALMGTIPSSLGKLNNLEEAHFQQNEFEGTIPISSATQVSADCDQVECPNCFVCCGVGQKC